MLRWRFQICAVVLVVAMAQAEQRTGEGFADRAWGEMVAAEELIHALTPALSALGRAVEGGLIPDVRTQSLFAARVEVRDLGEATPLKPVRGAGSELSSYTFAPAADVATVALADLRLWRSPLARWGQLSDVRFKVLRGRFADAAGESFVADLAVAARASREGQVSSLRGTVQTVWRRSLALTDGPLQWRIESWTSGSFEVLDASATFFADALTQAVPDQVERRALQRSRHEELALAKLRDRSHFRNPHPHFFVGSQDRHPGLAISDVDGDSFDDIYLLARWGPARLLRGSADGTFTEAAGELGLAIEDHISSAVFADFDNDGDQDVFVGRTMAPSLYLENRDGRFVDQSQVFGGDRLPALVSSVNAVDVNNDGLLDLYVSTYAAQMLVFELKLYQARHPGRVAPAQLLGDVLPAPTAAELSRRIRTRGAHLYMSLPGPPNQLFLNRGGRFEPAPPGPWQAYRNTYQATWADYDGDGDADVYLVHDFAPNQMLRNDGAGGFADVTEATGTADIGFGMGATWADYDGDGRQDLYVSNMYSKAGRRVTSYFAEADERLSKMAQGNSLFRNRGDRFEQAAGAPPKLPVANAGWSWGGQFADFDHDTHPDLYVASGYYTAPAEVAVAVDT